jgi:hypothetical protein
VLDRLGFELLRCSEIWEEHHMDEYHGIMTEAMLELASGFEEVLILHITYRPTDLDDGNISIRSFISCFYFLLDEIREVWDDLDSSSEEVSTTLPSNQLLIELA